MLLHYLRVIFRNLLVDKTYLSINVFGLAVGIASILIIAQYVQFELGFDRDFGDQDRIYYSYANVTFPSGANEIDLECHPAVAPFIIQHIPKIEAAVRIVPIGLESDESTVRRADEGSTFYSKENNLYYADSNVLDFFSVHMLKGNAKNALRDPNTIVMTEALAEKFFPNENPIDKEIKIRTNYGLKHFRITGVSETPPLNSSFQYSALCSFETINANGTYDNIWQWPLFRTFVKLRDDADAQIVEQNINTALLPLRKGLESADMKELIRLVPYAEYHFFKPQNIVETMPVRFTGDRRLITLLIVMGGIILVISWINYITLTNARSITRAKEIGLRKVNGATRNSLIFQFLLEFLIINLAALIVGVTLGQGIFPLFATVIGSNAPWIFVTEPWFWIAFFIFLFFSTLSAGIYPAIFMANYSPSHVLRGNFSTSKKGSLLRKCLVVTQFSFSISFLVSISVIHQQLRFMQTMNLGFETDQVLLIHTTDMDTARDQHLDFQLFKTGLEQNKNVKAVSSTDYFLGSRILRGQFFYLKDHPEKKPIPMVTNRVSEGFFDMMKMKLVCGNDFTDGAT